MKINYNQDLLKCIYIDDFNIDLTEHEILYLILKYHCKKIKGSYIITSNNFIKLFFKDIPKYEDLYVSKNQILSFIKNNIVEYVLTSTIYSDTKVSEINVVI